MVAGGCSVSVESAHGGDQRIACASGVNPDSKGCEERDTGCRCPSHQGMTRVAEASTVIQQLRRISAASPRMSTSRAGRRLGLLVLLIAVAFQSATAQQTVTAPAFLWGPGPIVGGPSGPQQQVSYEV